MLEIDKNRMLYELFVTRRYLAQSPCKDAIKYDHEGFAFLNYVYGKMMGSMFDPDKLFLDYEGANKVIDKKDAQNIVDFFKYCIHNKETINELFTNYTNMLDDIDHKSFPFYDIVRKYNEKDFKDIILSFYSQYGNNIYEAVKKYFDEERIQMGFEKEDYDDFAAAFSHITGFYSGYIVSISKKYNTWSLIDLIHELGHAVDAEMFLFPQQKTISIFPDVLCEIPSTYFEISILEYLINNKIDEDGASIIRNYKQGLVYDSAYEVIDAYKIPSFVSDEEGTVYDENGNGYDFRNGILYGLGYYFAAHLNYLKENMSSEEFNKTFYDLISTRKEANDIESSISKLGLSKKEFISGELIKNKIYDDNMALKRKYNY